MEIFIYNRYNWWRWVWSRLRSGLPE